MLDNLKSLRQALLSPKAEAEPKRFTAAEKGKWRADQAHGGPAIAQPMEAKSASRADPDSFSQASSDGASSRGMTPPPSPSLSQHTPMPSAPKDVTAKIVRSSVSSATIESWGEPKDGFVTFAVQYSKDGGKPETYNIAISVHADSQFVRGDSPSDAHKRDIEKALCELIDISKLYPEAADGAHRAVLTIDSNGTPMQAKIYYYDTAHQEHVVSLLDEELGKRTRKGALQQTNAQWLHAVSERLARLAKNQVSASVEKADLPGASGRAEHAVI